MEPCDLNLHRQQTLSSNGVVVCDESSSSANMLDSKQKPEDLPEVTDLNRIATFNTKDEPKVTSIQTTAPINGQKNSECLQVLGIRYRSLSPRDHSKPTVRMGAKRNVGRKKLSQTQQDMKYDNDTSVEFAVNEPTLVDETRALGFSGIRTTVTAEYLSLTEMGDTESHVAYNGSGCNSDKSNTMPRKEIEPNLNPGFLNNNDTFTKDGKTKRGIKNQRKAKKSKTRLSTTSTETETGTGTETETETETEVQKNSDMDIGTAVVENKKAEETQLQIKESRTTTCHALPIVLETTTEIASSTEKRKRKTENGENENRKRSSTTQKEKHESVDETMCSGGGHESTNENENDQEQDQNEEQNDEQNEHTEDYFSSRKVYRRSAHNEIERRRRENMNRHFDRLVEVLPTEEAEDPRAQRWGKPSRMQTLERAAQYIENNNQEAEKLKQENKRLAEELAATRGQIEKLKAALEGKLAEMRRIC